MTASSGSAERLRVIFFSVLPQAYQALAAWAGAHRHHVPLVVTTPGPAARRSESYRGVVAAAPAEQEILITTRLRRSLPLLASLRPDLIVSFTFPYRIPPEITALPRYGAVNLHPAPLPLYRGPNPMRMIFDAHPTIGATLHRTEEGFDTGVIFSRHERPMPDNVTAETVFAAWIPCMQAALEEGVERALRGDPGVPQDEAAATYGGAFTEEEKWLDWGLPARLLQCRATALNLFGLSARAQIEGGAYAVISVEPLAAAASEAAAGDVLDRTSDSFSVQTGDRPVRIVVAAIQPHSAGE